jgi:hypothetical protein
VREWVLGSGRRFLGLGAAHGDRDCGASLGLQVGSGEE